MGPVHHIALQVRDLERLEGWYRDGLGLPLVRRWEEDGGSANVRPGAEGRSLRSTDGAGRHRSSWLDLGGGAFLALERCVGEPAAGVWERQDPGWLLVALRIAPGERAVWEARLAAHGVTVERRSPWTIYFRDPEGNRLALSHHPEPRAAEPA